MALVVSPVTVALVTLETTVKSTSMNVHQLSVRMAEHAKMASIPTPVNVKVDTMETIVKTT